MRLVCVLASVLAVSACGARQDGYWVNGAERLNCAVAAEPNQLRAYFLIEPKAKGVLWLNDPDMPAGNLESSEQQYILRFKRAGLPPMGTETCTGTITRFDGRLALQCQDERGPSGTVTTAYQCKPEKPEPVL